MVNFLGYVPEATASPDNLVQQLIALRRKLLIPRSEFAEILGVSYAALWAWETGHRQPRGRSLALVRAFLAERGGAVSPPCAWTPTDRPSP